jgi:hypothetical protein
MQQLVQRPSNRQGGPTRLRDEIDVRQVERKSARKKGLGADRGQSLPNTSTHVSTVRTPVSETPLRRDLFGSWTATSTSISVDAPLSLARQRG